MKRIAVAGSMLLAASGAAYAVDTDVVLSGNIGFSLSYFDADNVEDTALKNNASRLGVFASATEGGIKGFVAYERGFDRFNPGSANNESQDFVREFFGGVSGVYGTLIYGRTKTDYRIAGERLDPFYDTSVSGFNGQFSNEGANYGLSNLTNGFTSGSVIYRSPEVIDGLSFNAAGYVDGRTGPGERHDYGLGVDYAREGLLLEGDRLLVGVQALEIRNPAVSGIPFNPSATVGGSPGESTNVRVHASYGAGDLWNVGLSFENVDVSAESSARQYFYLSGTYQLLERIKLAAAVGLLDFADNAPPIDGIGYTVGAFYSVTRNLNAYAAVRYVDYDSNPATDDTTSVAVGMSYSFDVDLR